LFPPGLGGRAGDALDTFVSLERRRVEGRASVPSRLGARGPTKLQTHPEIRRDGFILFLGVPLMPHESSLMGAQIVLRLANLGAERLQILVHGLRGVAHVV